jgi:hypothetical protein
VTVTVSLINPLGFPGFGDEVLTGSDLRIPGVYENSAFSIQLQYVYDDGVNIGVPSTVTVTSYTINGVVGPALTSSALDTLQMNGIIGSVFTDNYYEFLMDRNGTIEQLPENTTKPYRALVEWHPPTVKTFELSHIVVSSITNGFTTVINTTTIAQTVNWQLGSALTSFKALLAKGVI